MGNAVQTSFLAKEVGDFILLHNQALTYVHHRFKLSNVNSLQSSFSTTTTLDHHIEKLTVHKQCLVNQRDLKSILMAVGKLFKLDCQSFFFSCD